MTLYPRTSEEWQGEEARDKAWAHSILDLLKAGEAFEDETVESALRITGDLLNVAEAA